MKYRYYSKLPESEVQGPTTSDGGPILGRCLIPKDDNVHFTSYEMQLEPGKEMVLISPDKSTTNHIYYCIDGEAKASIKLADQLFTLTRDCMLALPPGVQAKLEVVTKCRLFILHCQSGDADPNEPKPLFRTLKEIKDTERDVDWIGGDSRRLLVRDDGFNISLHNTTAHPNMVSPLWYKNHFEGLYWIRGAVKYSWDDDTSESGFDEMDQADGDGLVIVLDENEPHKVHSFSTTPEAICMFYPPLIGNETHDFSSGSYSSYMRK